MSELFTRADYMKFSSFEFTKEERAAAHRRYFAQFVNESTIRYVVSSIGAEVIKASTDPHMNDIPLRRWDNMHKCLPIAMSLKSLGECNSLSTTVCIAKEAARQFAERN